MTSYTLPLLEAESQLRKLVERTQHTHQPIVLTAGETAEPVAILLEPSRFGLLQQREYQLFHLRLQELQRQLDHFALMPANETSTQQFTGDFQAATRTLWNICPQPQRNLCTTLVMAVRRLRFNQWLPEQVKVLQDGFELLRQETPDATVLASYHQRLFNCGLPPTMGGDNRLAQLYEDAL